MRSTDISFDIPTWFRLVCCATPLASLLIVTIGLATGSKINPFVIAVLVPLCWRIVGRMLEIEGTPFVVSLQPNSVEEKNSHELSRTR